MIVFSVSIDICMHVRGICGPTKWAMLAGGMDVSLLSVL